MNGGRLRAQELAALGLDLESSLREEPRFLLDGRFLAALHTELHGQLETPDARAALLQLGFLHGLRDALATLKDGFGSGFEPRATLPSPARLAIRIVPDAGNPLDVRGSWPDRREALSVLELAGAAGEPVCTVSAGYTSGWLSGVFEADLLAIEHECAAMGHEQCRFSAREPVRWIASGESAALETLEGLPFGALRDIVGRHLAEASPPASGDGEFDPGTPVVHVWGPVMVLPFSGPDESLRALDLIGRDPGARDVRVVVLDLAGAIIDEGFGAAALEQVVEAVASWGAEALITGISPLSELAVAELERTHGVLRKDLPEAVASAFQIAEALRRSS